MNIKNKTNIFNLNFRSGLNNRIISSETSMDIKICENMFTEVYGVETHFCGNKSAAFANNICLKIVEKLSENLNLNIFLPPVICIYNADCIIDKNSAPNFCISDTCNVLKNDYPFPGRSVFFKNFNNLEEIDNSVENQFRNKISSSSHFLAPFIHEWLHSLHLDYIYKKFGYGGDCTYLNEFYPLKKSKQTGIQLLKMLENKKLSPKENEIIFDTLGYYSTLPTNQYLEIFSEAFTKFICDSLSGIHIIKNPLEQLKKTSKDFQNIFHKV